MPPLLPAEKHIKFEMSAGPPQALSLNDKQKYRERLCAEVDGLRRQVEELRQHVQQGNPHMANDQSFMAQLQGKRGLNSQPFSQQHRGNMLNSLSPSMGQDMRPGMSPGVPTQSGLNDDIINQGLLRKKQLELDEIMEHKRQLYSNLDNLDRQRSQILGDIDKTSVYQKMSNDMSFFQGQSGGGRFPPSLGRNLPPHLSPSMHPGHQMRSPSSTLGAAREALHGHFSLLSNRNSMGKPDPSMMDPDVGGGFGNLANSFPPNTPAAGTLGALRGRYEKLQEMEGNANLNDPTHIDKRRRFLSAGSNDFAQKPHFGMRGMSSSFLPSEIMVNPKNAAPGDTLSVLSSSHQLLMSQREANMQREAQNMMFFQGINNGRNVLSGLNRAQAPLHDGKLPETKRKLSKDFVPEMDTVVLGKGNIPKTNIGNLKLKGIVMDNLVEYANGERRKKIAVISRIINHVTAANYKTTGFVKFEDECWWEMTERDARVKITALFRDCLHDQYRSSSSSKVKRRQELRKSRSLAASNVKKEAEKATADAAGKKDTGKETNESVSDKD